MKPRLRFSRGVWCCGLMVPFFDAGWVYMGMSETRGCGITPEEAFRAWEKKTEAAAVSAAQS